MMHNNMTPNTGEDDMYWALILRGIGFYYLFIPIAIYFIWKNIGEGAAFTGMMRQLEAHLVLQSSLLSRSQYVKFSLSFRQQNLKCNNAYSFTKGFMSKDFNEAKKAYQQLIIPS
jgi:DHA2 family multidrug resistance protein